MDIITERASKYVKYNFTDRVPNHKRALDEIKEELELIDDNLDKVKFINVIIKSNNDSFEIHKKLCTDSECTQEYEHGNILYFLNQELKRIGVNIDLDTINEDEKEFADTKLDKILKDLKEVKLGQEIIYEDLLKELNELKDLYFLGKKNWHQLLVGKCFDMVASGIVSETISKQIIQNFDNHFPNLLQ